MNSLLDILLRTQSTKIFSSSLLYPNYHKREHLCAYLAPLGFSSYYCERLSITQLKLEYIHMLYSTQRYNPFDLDDSLPEKWFLISMLLFKKLLLYYDLPEINLQLHSKTFDDKTRNIFVRITTTPYWKLKITLKEKMVLHKFFGNITYGIEEDLRAGSNVSFFSIFDVQLCQKEKERSSFIPLRFSIYDVDRIFTINLSANQISTIFPIGPIRSIYEYNHTLILQYLCASVLYIYHSTLSRFVHHHVKIDHDDVITSCFGAALRLGLLELRHCCSPEEISMLEHVSDDHEIANVLCQMSQNNFQL